MPAYVYILEDAKGKAYIGSKTCKNCFKPNHNPATDGYMGSSTDSSYKPINKTVLATFELAQEALAHEMLLHDLFNVAISPLFANRAKQTNTKFNTKGASPSAETRAKLSRPGELNSFYGKKHTPEAIAKMRKPRSEAGKANMRGKERSPEHCANISKAKAGVPVSKARRLQIIANANKPDVKAKMLASQAENKCTCKGLRYTWTGRLISEEACLRAAMLIAERQANRARQWLNPIDNTTLA